MEHTLTLPLFPLPTNTRVTSEKLRRKKGKHPCHQLKENLPSTFPTQKPSQIRINCALPLSRFEHTQHLKALMDKHLSGDRS